MILVTGGLGMIGAHTAQALLDLGEEVVVTRHHSGDVPSFLRDRVTVEQLDVSKSFLDLGDRHDITGIVHLAAPRPSFAPSPTGQSVADTVEFLRINTTGLLNALEAARAWKVRRFATASSIGVYLGRSEPSWHEELALPTMSIDNPILAFKEAAKLEAAVPGAQVALTPGGRQDPYLDITRLTADTGFAPRFDATTAVADFVGWLATNPR